MTDDTVTVQPVRTFLEGRELKHPESEPYPVHRLRADDLARNGLVMRVPARPETAAVESEPPQPESVQALPAAALELAEPEKRGRGRPRKS